jgi:hypothetical protein
MTSNIKYNTAPVDDRYDNVCEIGYMTNYEFELTDEPFDMGTAMYWRWDKDSRGWVAGLIKKNGNWVRGDTIEGQLLGKWRKLKSRLGIENQE